VVSFLGKTKKRFILFITLFLSVMTLTLKNNWVRAEELLELSPTEYETHLNGVIKTSNIYTEIDTFIDHYFPDFGSQNFETTVTGLSTFRILEVTPRSYRNSTDEVSDLSSQSNLVEEIFARAITKNGVTNKYFIQNLPRFEVEVMTVKEFNSSRESLKGKYDAILFSAGEYLVDEYNNCSSTPVTVVNPTGGTKTTEYYNNNNIKYDGYKLNNQYHGYGKLYASNGLVEYEGTFQYGEYHGEGTTYNTTNGKKIYSGGWNEGEYHGKGKVYHNNGRVAFEGYFDNGERSCFGKEFTDDSDIVYIGKWLKGNRHGFGTTFDSSGNINFEGFWNNNIQSTDTTPHELLNDITELKAKEVINDFINEGLPVFIHQDALNDQRTVFYQFNSLTTKSNVFTLNYQMTGESNNIPFYQALAMMSMTEVLSNKPYVHFSTKPIDYFDNPNHAYQANDELKFSINLTNKEQANFIFYLDINQNNVIEDNEVDFLDTINTLVEDPYTFNYVLPATYTGLVKYRIAIESDGLVSNFDGTIKVGGASSSIKVLNVVSESVKTKNSLFNDALLRDLLKVDGYDITIDSCDIKAFSKNNEKKDCSHESVMEDYDVIVLGQDIFDNSMTKHVYNSLQYEINKGKPVIFTSSFTKGHTAWIEYFSDDLALQKERTDLYTLNSVDHLQIMNQYSYNTYPFNLNNLDLTIPSELNFAFNEQFRIDLNNAQLVPLLNMYQREPYNIDRFDSYNNYYFMKVQNVLYLNIGTNSFKTYTELEHKLLVNAVVNAYVEAKSKDKVLEEKMYFKVENDYKDALIDFKDSVNFDFSVLSNAKDTEEETFTYRVYVNNKEVEMNTVGASQNVSINLNNIATPNLNSATQAYIQVIVEDEDNNRMSYDFNVFVANMKDYLTIEKSMSTHNGTEFIELNKEQTITYKLNLSSISFPNIQSNQLPKQLVLKNVQLTDFIPNGLNVNSTTYEKVALENGTKVTIPVQDLVFNLNSTKQYVAVSPSLSYTLKVAPNKVGDYVLNQTRLTLTGIGNDQEELSSNSRSVKAIKGLDGNDVIVNFEGDLFIPSYSPTINIKDLITIKREQTGVLSAKVNGADLETFIYEANKMPKLTPTPYTVTVTDVFGNVVTKTFRIITAEPISYMHLDPLELEKGTTSVLPLTLNPVVNLDNVKITSHDTKGVFTYEVIDNQIMITAGTKAGYAKISVSGYDPSGKLITQEAIINVYEKIRFETPQSTKVVFIGDTLPYPNLIIVGEDQYRVEFISNNDEVATYNVETGLIEAHKPGVAVIEAYLVDKSTNLPTGDSVAIIVKVSDYLSEDTGFIPEIVTGEIPVYAGELLDLRELVDIYPLNTEMENLRWEFEVDGVTLGMDEFYHTFSEAKYYQVKVTISQLDENGNVLIAEDGTLRQVEKSADIFAKFINPSDRH
jgi:hypothetical protein